MWRNIEGGSSRPGSSCLFDCPTFWRPPGTSMASLWPELLGMGGLRKWGELNLTIYGHCLATNHPSPQPRPTISSKRKAEVPIFFRWNEGTPCSKPNCRYSHIYRICGGLHKQVDCSKQVTHLLVLIYLLYLYLLAAGQLSHVCCSNHSGLFHLYNMYGYIFIITVYQSLLCCILGIIIVHI